MMTCYVMAGTVHMVIDRDDWAAVGHAHVSQASVYTGAAGVLASVCMSALQTYLRTQPIEVWKR